TISVISYVYFLFCAYAATGIYALSLHDALPIWNNFLWPLIITNSVEARPLTVGLQVFSSGDQGVDWSVICAATLLTSAPLLIGRSEEHTSELQSRENLVCRLLLEKKKKKCFHYQ